MPKVVITRSETVLFLVSFFAPLGLLALLSFLVDPLFEALLPTSLLFPAGLLAGIAMRGPKAEAATPLRRERVANPA